MRATYSATRVSSVPPSAGKAEPLCKSVCELAHLGAEDGYEPALEERYRDLLDALFGRGLDNDLRPGPCLGEGSPRGGAVARGSGRSPVRRRGRGGPPGRPGARQPGARTGRGRSSTGNGAAPAGGSRRVAPRARIAASAWRPSSSSASIRSSTTPSRSSSRRAIADWAKASNAKSASGGPCQRVSASRRPHDSGLGVPGARGRDKLEDARRVQFVAFQAHEVAGRLRDDAVGSEELSELGDGVLERRRCGPRRFLAPEPVDETVGGDDIARVEEQEREQRALIAASEPHRRPTIENLERSKDPEFHKVVVAP